MNGSEFISLCAVSRCNAHLDTRHAKSHPTIHKGFLCTEHQYMHTDALAAIEKVKQAYFDQWSKSVPVLPEMPVKAYKVTAWDDKGYKRLEKALGLSREDFNKTFEAVPGGDV